MLENLKTKTKLFLASTVALSIAFIVYLQYTLNKNYSQSSKIINYENIKNLVEKIDKDINYFYRIALDFSSLDETYNFIEKPNNQYIHKNFRKDSYTLEDLNLSFFILINKENDIKYSKLVRNMNYEKKNSLLEFFAKQLKEKDEVNSIIKFGQFSYFISKHPVYKTDYENGSNGFVILGRKIDSLYLKELTNSFEESKFSFLKEHKNPIISNSLYFPTIATSTTTENDILISQISFYDENNNFILGIQTKDNIKLSHDMFMIICILSTFLLLVILILIFIVNSYKKLFTHNQKNIDEQIDTKTQQMKTALKELEKINVQLFDIAHTDHLTKTMNRRNFFIHSQNAFAIAKRNNLDVCTIMIDIDRFKNINDKYGHDVGDKVLIEFAKTIKRNIKEKDIFGRLGGEEFSLVLPNTNIKNATKKAEQLKEEIEKIEIFVHDNILSVTASFGVSDNKDCENIDEMLQKADKLLYSAKSEGRNLVRSRY